MRETSTVSREIAARVWCDQEMGHCVMDVDAAEEIAAIIERVRRNNEAAGTAREVRP